MGNKELQVVELNTIVKTRIGASKIHGVGCMAILDLKKGERLYADNIPKVYTLTHADLGKLFPEIRDMILEQWPNIVNGARFAYPTTRIQAYMNHSEDPNYDAMKDELLKDVSKGEEITHDYRLIKNYQTVYPWLTT